ncbi:MAG: FtsX-like permease family protein, partial [Acidobacteriota bacterium]
RQFGFPNNDPFTVVGVARDAKYVQLGEDPRSYFYLPLEQKYAAGVTLHYRSAGDPSEALPTVLRSIRQIDRELPLIRPGTVEERIQMALWAPRLGAALLSAYGLLILLLSALGVYGVMAYSVRQRFREIGLRMALGAQRLDVLQLILKQGMLIAAIGIGAGLLLALALERSIYSLLYGVDSSDPLTLVMTVFVLAAAALLASYLPAFRASRVDPNRVLRYE